MAKRALRSRLNRLELPGRKSKAETAPANSEGQVRNPIASLELKVGEETRRLPSPKAAKEEKLQLEKVKKIESREKALRLIEKFREKEKIERADLTHRNWQADESDRAQRAENAVQKAHRGWKIARIAYRLVFGTTMIYYGVRGIGNLIFLVLYPPALNPGIAISGLWVGIALVGAVWVVQRVRQKLADYEDLDWVPYVRVVLLAWIPLVTLTAMLFLGRLVTPSVEAFIRIAWVYFYVTVLACWYYFLTVV